MMTKFFVIVNENFRQVGFPRTGSAAGSGKIKVMSDAESTAKPPEDFEDFKIPIPPASFSFIVLSLRAQTEMHLGLMRMGEGEPEPDLDLARHAIDLMAVLLEKTKGNLSLEEQRLLENSVTELRFRFVQVSDDLAKKAVADQKT